MGTDLFSQLVWDRLINLSQTNWENRSVPIKYVPIKYVPIKYLLRD